MGTKKEGGNTGYLKRVSCKMAEGVSSPLEKHFGRKSKKYALGLEVWCLLKGAPQINDKLD